uniref:Uncharacterized protein n=1 Tax=Utricularia reniformis TaxID=192314 RepID=A0A1Y0B0H7_9LAMI|nr:hypothetical protein AEK19_MT0687 [Utricularia reniformis]ART30935.1 hypothetical protein AEK19_MT0687 [Utricularia reniformis]
MNQPSEVCYLKSTCVPPLEKSPELSLFCKTMQMIGLGSEVGAHLE